MTRRPARSYRQRYSGRWTRTCTVLTVVLLCSNLVRAVSQVTGGASRDASYWLGYVVAGAVVAGAAAGSLVNLVVAAVPDRRAAVRPAPVPYRPDPRFAPYQQPPKEM